MATLKTKIRDMCPDPLSPAQTKLKKLVEDPMAGNDSQLQKLLDVLNNYEREVKGQLVIVKRKISAKLAKIRKRME